MLSEAAAQFNARGIASVSLSDIAGKLGLTRAALYYYVDDRADLVFECYARACAFAADDLQTADETGASGLAKVLAFVGRALDPDRPATAVLSDIAFLAPPQRDIVSKAHRRNVHSLREFIREGVVDGSIRACDDEVAAQTVLGMVSWAPLSGEWIESGDAAGRYATRLRAAALDIVTHGIAARPIGGFACPIDIAAFEMRPPNAFDRKEAAAQKIEAFARTACRLFNQKGIDGASLDEITTATGASTGALYHYITDRNELVALCYRRSFDLHDRFAEAARDAGRTGLERVLFGVHLNAQALMSDLSPLMPTIGFESLESGLRAEFRSRTNKLNKTFEKFCEDGALDGSVRALDVRFVVLMGSGAFIWMPKWLESGGDRSAREIAEEVAKFIANGLGNAVRSDLLQNCSSSAKRIEGASVGASDTASGTEP